jgi:RHS repeat-associated protein
MRINYCIKFILIMSPEGKKESTCNMLYYLREAKGTEAEIYYFHPDHLGSASWITDQDGRAIQHLQYLPFGETRLDQRTTGWSSRYTFSGKEKDEESGYSYFGARYYNSDLGIWLSPDPLSDLAPHQTPYAYCSNHPINRIDPNGMWDGNYYTSDGTWLGWDGINDGNIYIVADYSDQSYVSGNTTNGLTTPLGAVPSAMELPNESVRHQMIDELIEADKKNPFAEHGGLYGQKWNSKANDYDPQYLEWAPSGPTTDPCPDNLKVIGPDYNAIKVSGFRPSGAFHSHPSGTCATDGEPFKQPASRADLDNAVDNYAKYNGFAMNKPSMAFSMKYSTVDLYDHKGSRATLTFDIFLKLR